MALLVLAASSAAPSGAMAIPFAGDAPATSSSVDVHQVVAGTLNRRFRVTVTHTSVLPFRSNTHRLSGSVAELARKGSVDPEDSPIEPSVTDVRIVSPPGFAIQRVLAPTGSWRAWIDPDHRSALFLDGKLPAGRSLTFTVFSNVPSPPQSAMREWAVYVSNDGGETLWASGPSHEKALATEILVL